MLQSKGNIKRTIENRMLNRFLYKSKGSEGYNFHSGSVENYREYINSVNSYYQYISFPKSSLPSEWEGKLRYYHYLPFDEKNDSVIFTKVLQTGVDAKGRPAYYVFSVIFEKEDLLAIKGDVLGAIKSIETTDIDGLVSKAPLKYEDFVPSRSSLETFIDFKSSIDLLEKLISALEQKMRVLIFVSDNYYVPEDKTVYLMIFLRTLLNLAFPFFHRKELWFTFFHETFDEEEYPYYISFIPRFKYSPLLTAILKERNIKSAVFDFINKEILHFDGTSLTPYAKNIVNYIKLERWNHLNQRMAEIDCLEDENFFADDSESYKMLIDYWVTSDVRLIENKLSLPDIKDEIKSLDSLFQKFKRKSLIPLENDFNSLVNFLLKNASELTYQSNFGNIIKQLLEVSDKRRKDTSNKSLVYSSIEIYKSFYDKFLSIKVDLSSFVELLKISISNFNLNPIICFAAVNTLLESYEVDDLLRNKYFKNFMVKIRTNYQDAFENNPLTLDTYYLLLLKYYAKINDINLFKEGVLDFLKDKITVEGKGFDVELFEHSKSKLVIDRSIYKDFFDKAIDLCFYKTKDYRKTADIIYSEWQETNESRYFDLILNKFNLIPDHDVKGHFDYYFNYFYRMIEDGNVEQFSRLIETEIDYKLNVIREKEGINELIIKEINYLIRNAPDNILSTVEKRIEQINFSLIEYIKLVEKIVPVLRKGLESKSDYFVEAIIRNCFEYEKSISSFVNETLPLVNQTGNIDLLIDLWEYNHRQLVVEKDKKLFNLLVSTDIQLMKAYEKKYSEPQQFIEAIMNKNIFGESLNKLVNEDSLIFDYAKKIHGYLRTNNKYTSLIKNLEENYFSACTKLRKTYLIEKAIPIFSFKTIELKKLIKARREVINSKKEPFSEETIRNRISLIKFVITRQKPQTLSEELQTIIEDDLRLIDKDQLKYPYLVFNYLEKVIIEIDTLQMTSALEEIIIKINNIFKQIAKVTNNDSHYKEAIRLLEKKLPQNHVLLINNYLDWLDFRFKNLSKGNLTINMSDLIAHGIRILLYTQNLDIQLIVEKLEKFYQVYSDYYTSPEDLVRVLTNLIEKAHRKQVISSALKPLMKKVIQIIDDNNLFKPHSFIVWRTIFNNNNDLNDETIWYYVRWYKLFLSPDKLNKRQNELGISKEKVRNYIIRYSVFKENITYVEEIIDRCFQHFVLIEGINFLIELSNYTVKNFDKINNGREYLTKIGELFVRYDADILSSDKIEKALIDSYVEETLQKIPNSSLNSFWSQIEEKGFKYDIKSKTPNVQRIITRIKLSKNIDYLFNKYRKDIRSFVSTNRQQQQVYRLLFEKCIDTQNRLAIHEDLVESIESSVFSLKVGSLLFLTTVNVLSNIPNDKSRKNRLEQTVKKFNKITKKRDKKDRFDVYSILLSTLLQSEASKSLLTNSNSFVLPVIISEYIKLGLSIDSEIIDPVVLVNTLDSTIDYCVRQLKDGSLLAIEVINSLLLLIEKADPKSSKVVSLVNRIFAHLEKLSESFNPEDLPPRSLVDNISSMLDSYVKHHKKSKNDQKLNILKDYQRRLKTCSWEILGNIAIDTKNKNLWSVVNDNIAIDTKNKNLWSVVNDNRDQKIFNMKRGMNDDN